MNPAGPPSTNPNPFPTTNAKIMHKHLRYWYLYLMGLVLSVIAANLYLQYYATPQYGINSTLLIKEGNSQPNVEGAGALGDGKAGTTKNINDEIQMLKSRSLMHRVVSELALTTRYQVEDKIRNTEIYKGALPVNVIVSRLDSAVYGQPFTLRIKSDNSFEWGESSGQTGAYRFGQPIRKPYGEFTVVATASKVNPANDQPKRLLVTFLSARTLAERYNRNLTVLPVNKDANVLNLSLVDPIPQRGKDVMNKLIDVYNEEGLEDKNRLAANTLTFIDDRMKRLTASLSGVERSVEQYKRRNKVTDVSAHASNYLAQASDYNKKLSDWAIQIDVLESIESYLGKNSSQYKMVPSTLGLQDQTLLDLIAKFNDLQLDRERMLRTAQANNPLVQNMNEQLGNLRANILENLRNIKSGLTITSQNLKASSGEFENRIQQVPSIERDLLEISRQQATKQNLYLFLLQKREEAALALAATVSKSKVIDPAMATENPVSPNTKLMYLLGLLVGLGLPFTLIYFVDKLNGKIQTRQDVEQLTNTPVLGELLHSKRGTLVVTKGNFSPIVEMFGLIRAQLNTITAYKQNRVLLVTSSMSGEGKTFLSINLGASLALMGKKVVVLELDFRAPNLLAEVGVLEGTGIADYLSSDDVSIGDIISPVEKVTNLFVAGSGSIPLNPAELMTSPKLTYLVNELKVSFDYIIIDTAPVGQVADAFSLSPLSDTTIYVMRYNYTLKAQIDQVNTIAKTKGLPDLMIVLNDAKKQNVSAYSYGYGYGQAKGKTKKKALPVSKEL